MSFACIAASTIGASAGFALQIPDLLTAGAILLGLAAASLLFCDTIVVDGRRHLITRKKGVWPLLQERSRPFSEVDHVCVEQMPSLEPDGSVVRVARLSIVRKYGSPIVLARTYGSAEALQAEAENLATLLGVEAQSAGPDPRYQVSAA